MRKNALLILAVFVSVLLAFNSFRKISDFRSTSNLVEKDEQRLVALKQQNEELKRELEYKTSERFVEEEIRDKLGLVKEGEQVFVVPGDEKEVEDTVRKKQLPNWRKWQLLIFGS